MSLKIEFPQTLQEKFRANQLRSPETDYAVHEQPSPDNRRIVTFGHIGAL